MCLLRFVQLAVQIDVSTLKKVVPSGSAFFMSEGMQLRVGYGIIS